MSNYNKRFEHLSATVSLQTRQQQNFFIFNFNSASASTKKNPVKLQNISQKSDRGKNRLNCWPCAVDALASQR